MHREAEGKKCKVRKSHAPQVRVPAGEGRPIPEDVDCESITQNPNEDHEWGQYTLDPEAGWGQEVKFPAFNVPWGSH